MSLVTVASLGDLGYRVNYAAADPYSLSLLLRAGPSTVIPLGNDIMKRPIMVVDAAGRVVGTIKPR